MKKGLLTIVFLLISACSAPKTHFAPTGTAKYDPYVGEVRIFDSFPKTKPYETLGDVTAEAYLSNPNEQVIHSLKKEAAGHGANGIVMSENDISSNIQYSMQGLIGAYEAPKKAKAVAIRVGK